ncbi:MAG: hypothetical protein IT319_19720 [Anaerolineae bacterium]|nr:hypothetical protein [Anaerolineae bacterium]
MNEQFLYYRHVVFDNSLTAGGYYHSHAAAVAPSEIKSFKGKLPVSETYFISPPN